MHLHFSLADARNRSDIIVVCMWQCFLGIMWDLGRGKLKGLPLGLLRKLWFQFCLTVYMCVYVCDSEALPKQ